MLNFPSEKKRNKLNNPFRRTHLNRSTAFNASVFNACPVRGLIFFSSPAFPQQMDFCHCSSAEGVRSFSVHQVETSRAS